MAGQCQALPVPGLGLLLGPTDQSEVGCCLCWAWMHTGGAHCELGLASTRTGPYAGQQKFQDTPRPVTTS